MRRTWMTRRNEYMRGVKGMRYEVRRRTFCNSPEKKKNLAQKHNMKL